MKSLARKNIVLTGGASGIGREMARLLAMENANLAIIDINEKALDDTRNELSTHNIKVHTYTCDLSKKDRLDTTAEKIKNDFRQIDILINNAGVISGKPITDLSYEDIKFTIDVNLMAGILMTKQFIPGMMERNSGHIVNVTSVAGLVGCPKMADYSASKFGTIGFSETLRLELRKYNATKVKVTIICPSFIDTGLFEGFKVGFSPTLKPGYVAEQIIKAVKNDKPFLILPKSTGKLIWFAKLFPISVQDKIWKFTGVTTAMDHFIGRK